MNLSSSYKKVNPNTSVRYKENTEEPNRTADKKLQPDIVSTQHKYSGHNSHLVTRFLQGPIFAT